MDILNFNYFSYIPRGFPKVSERVVDTITYTFSVGAITFGAISAHEVAAIAGVVVAALAYITGFVFKLLHYRLAVATASSNLKRRKEDKEAEEGVSDDIRPQ